MKRIIVAIAAFALGLAGCARPPAGVRVDPRTVTAMPARWPAAPVAAGTSAPRIVRLWLSATRITPGRDWLGRIATTTNVASVEVRTESFSFNARRIAFGQFVFDQHVLDIVPQYKRPYLLNVIARNAAGAEDVRLVPIDLR